MENAIKIWLQKDENGNLVVLGSEPPGKEGKVHANADYLITLPFTTAANGALHTQEGAAHIQALVVEEQPPA